MKNGFMSILFGFILFSCIGEIFAMEVACPVVKKTYTPEVIRGKIQECLDKRQQKKEASITEFYCPSGDAIYQDGRPLTDDTIPYHVAVALYFAEIDEDALMYMCTLREIRVKSARVWTENMRKKIELTSSDSAKSFAKRYTEVCDFIYIQNKINTPEKKWITNTETYPQSVCKELARRKSQAWYNMSKILMSEGIAKTWQNEKDTFVDKVKGKYSIIIDKYVRYSLAASKAISNLTGLPKKTIQR